MTGVRIVPPDGLKASRSAVFLDRDGTLIEDRGYLRRSSEIVMFPDTVRSLRLLQRDCALFIVTHQVGVAQGAITMQEALRVNQALVERLAGFGVRIEETYCCPHSRSDGCQCIKPKPYHLHVAAREFGIDLGGSFVIGDHPHDVMLAKNAGASGIYVLSGHGRKHREDVSSGATVVNGIWDAAILAAKAVFARRSCDDLVAQVTCAARIISEGGVVAVPTETVYGLCANALDGAAVAKIFEVKRRPRFDPLIIHVSSIEEARSLVTNFPRVATELAERFWPGPLTLVLPRGRRVRDIAAAGLPTVAVRMPDHPMTLAVIRKAGVPVAAPSANPFGGVSPTTADHVRLHLGGNIDMVLDGGPCRVGVESTIVSLSEDPPVLLRPGGTTREEIEDITGPLAMPVDADRPASPGRLSHHYAPKTPLVLCDQVAPPVAACCAGLLAFRPPSRRDGFAAVEVLSQGGDLREAATNLFAAIHRLDAMNLEVIFAERLPPRGLGAAINDRLERAAHAGPGTSMPRSVS